MATECETKEYDNDNSPTERLGGKGKKKKLVKTSSHQVFSTNYH